MVELHRSRLEAIYIPGGFDLFHLAHRNFLNECIQQASDRFDFETIVIGLAPDANVARKGKYRPYFPLAWRGKDLKNWSESNFPQYDIHIEERGAVAFDEEVTRNTRRAIIISSEHGVRAVRDEYQRYIATYSTTVDVPSVSGVHTSDIEKLLFQTDNPNDQNLDNAVLLRDGEVVTIYSCESTDENSSGIQSFGVLCSAVAKQGDFLLTTQSPTLASAETIAAIGIDRVVFHELKDIYAVRRLEHNGVFIRKAGMN